jgi:hypothetical protein
MALKKEEIIPSYNLLNSLFSRRIFVSKVVANYGFFNL